jgi:putative protease
MPEILAPAGNRESLEAAVRSGADAVYLGLPFLSARKNADNFSEEELINACRYCHERGVSVYLAVNTILKDSEFELAERAAEIAAKAGVDALIVADLGLIDFFKTTVPDIPIHASTQCSVFSRHAVKVLEELGVKRVVLARELSFEEIKEIRENTSLELEVFVHGALCMSVSGQCLFSSFLGGRSGNRGLCAGTCRLPFYSSASKEDYSLSLKDLSLYDQIERLRDIGVESFKIEGRMKRPEYVSAAVKNLKDSLDNKAYDKHLLEDVFSRGGFTDGYFSENLASDMFGKREKDDVLAAPAAFSKIHEYYKRERQSIPVSASFSLSENKATLTFSDGKHSVGYTSFSVSPAREKGVDEEFIKEKISKLGSTPFYLSEFSSEISNGLYISAKDINQMKNECADKLLDLRGRREPAKVLPYPFLPGEKRNGNLAKKYAYLSVYDKKIADNFDKVFLDINKITDQCIPDKTVIVLPRYFTPKKESELTKKLAVLKEKGFVWGAAGDLNSLGLLKELSFNIIVLPSLNTINSAAAFSLYKLGVKEIILSVENSFSSAENIISSLPTGAYLYGFVPLMLLRTCPITKKRDCKNCKVKGGVLRDRLGEEFKVRCSEEYSELLNSRILHLLHKKDSFKNLDIAFYDLRETNAEKSLAAILSNSPPDSKFTYGLYPDKLL